jgi:hypothetical protein
MDVGEIPGKPVLDRTIAIVQIAVGMLIVTT